MGGSLIWFKLYSLVKPYWALWDKRKQAMVVPGRAITPQRALIRALARDYSIYESTSLNWFMRLEGLVALARTVVFALIWGHP